MQILRLDSLRIIDASANRASEALRVIEDYARFALDDSHLTGQLKQMRHDLASSLAAVGSLDRHFARETQADVGAEISTSAELVRANIGSVLASNFERAKQSLRSLEEYLKIEQPEIARQIEQIRYRTYTLERSLSITVASVDRLADVRLYVLIDGQHNEPMFGELVGELISTGTGAIQLRDKTLDDRRLMARARQLVTLLRDSDTLSIINDRPDIAALSHADGVHLGQDELPVKDARRLVGANGLIGVSTHNLRQARAAVLDGANYIGVGPTFPSGTKHFDHFPGLKFLGEVQREIRLPTFAIGGVTLENVDQVLSTGISRIAVGGAITGAADRRKAAENFVTVLEAQ